MRARVTVPTHFLTECYAGSIPVESSIVFDNDCLPQYNNKVRECGTYPKSSAQKCALFLISKKNPCGILFTGLGGVMRVQYIPSDPPGAARNNSCSTDLIINLF